MPFALPKFQRIRPKVANLDTLARLEDNVAAFAAALTDDRVGLLARALLLKGRFYTLTVTVPELWTAVPLAAPWIGDLGAPNQPLQWRKDDAGRVWLRGRFEHPGSAPIGVEPEIASLPPSFVPAHRELLEVYGTNSNDARQHTVISAWPTASTYPNRLSWSGGGWRALSASGQVSWEAQDKAPAAWPEASQPFLTLDGTFPGEPSQVLLVDALEEGTTRHVSGVEATWERVDVGNRKALRFRRFSGLVPLKQYTLTLAVLAA